MAFVKLFCVIQSSHESSRNDFATFLRILIKKKEYGSLPLIVKKERKNKKYIFMNSILLFFFFQLQNFNSMHLSYTAQETKTG